MRTALIILLLHIVLLVAGCGTVRETEALPFPATRYVLMIKMTEGNGAIADIAGIIASTGVLESVQVNGITSHRIKLYYRVFKKSDQDYIIARLGQLPGVTIINEFKE